MSSGTHRTADDARSPYGSACSAELTITLFDWLLSDTLQRHPAAVVLSEAARLIPYVLERVDYSWEHQGAWTHTTIRETAEQLLSPALLRCFISDRHGIENLDSIGVDNVMLETDYPHSDSTWPNSVRAAQDSLAGCDETTIYKVSRGNAERVFRFAAG